MYIKAIRNVHPLKVKTPSFGNMLFISGLVDYFVIVIAVDPHVQIKGKDNVQRY